MAEDSSYDTLTLTAEIVASYLGANSHVKPDEIPGIIKSIREALKEDSAPAVDQVAAGAAPKLDKRLVNKSITPDALISFIDNKPYKTLKRHISRHGHDMKSYREAYGLPSDYPSVAPSYSAARSEMAKSIGLGARRKSAVAEEPTLAKQARGGRKPKAAPAEQG